MADALRGSMDAAEYKHVVLGLIFLKYISDAFEEKHAALEAEKADGADPEDPDEYRRVSIFWVPPEARWPHLKAQARQPTVGQLVDDAMAGIERDNPSLKGVLPKDYARPSLDKMRLGQLIDLMSNITVGDAEARSKDVLGRVAENATWDQALLRDTLAGLQEAGAVDLLAIGFSRDEISAILAAAEEAVIDGDAPDEQDDADPGEAGTGGGGTADDGDAVDPADAEPEPPRAAVTRPGDLWLFGDHRLLCGDSTDAAAVARLMGDDRAALLFTSPPYGNQRDYTTGGIGDWDALMRGVCGHLDNAVAPDGQMLVNLGVHGGDKPSQWSAGVVLSAAG